MRGLVSGLPAASRPRIDPDERIPIAEYVALYNRVVRRLDDEGFGLFSQPLRPGTFEFLCRGMIGAPTLEVALDRASRFLALVLPDLALAIRREAGSARLEIAERRRLRANPNDPRRVFAFEWLLRLLHGVSSWLVARPLALAEVRFPYARPGHAQDYALVYTSRATFGSSTLVAVVDARSLDLPVRRRDADLEAFLEGAPGKISMLYRRDREMAGAVRDLLARSLPGSPALGEVARALRVSARTLHRRLEDEGTSFREVKDAVRREVAFARLEGSRDSVAEIAGALGYSEPSAFFRAFHGWTGVGPSAWRKRRAGESAIRSK